MLKLSYFTALVSMMLVMMFAGAHLLESHQKLQLAGDEYLIVQQIYQGWEFSAFVLLFVFISLGTILYFTYHNRSVFYTVLSSLILVMIGQVLFWTFVYPANVATENWTQLPSNWEALRTQWENAHAANAILTIVAFATLAYSYLRNFTFENSKN